MSKNQQVTLYFSPMLWLMIPLMSLGVLYFLYLVMGFTYHHMWLVVAILLLLGFILAYPMIEVDDEKIVYKRLCNIGNWQLDWQDVQRVYAVAKPMSQNSKIDSHFDITFSTENTIKRFSTANYINKQQFFDFLPITERLSLTAYQDLTLKQEYSWEIIAGLFYLCGMMILLMYIDYDNLSSALHIKSPDRSFWLDIFWSNKSFLPCIFYVAIYSINHKITGYVPLKTRSNFAFAFGGLMIFLFGFITFLPAWFRYQNEQLPINQTVNDCKFTWTESFYYQNWQCQNPETRQFTSFYISDNSQFYDQSLKENQMYLIRISEGKLQDFFIKPKDFQQIIAKNPQIKND